MYYLDAAHEVLLQAREPLHYIEIARRALDQGLIEPEGKTPAATMGSRLYVDTKKPDSRFRRAGKARFALAERRRVDDIAGRVAAINLQTRKQLHRLLHDMPADQFEALIGELLIALGFDESTVEVTQYHSDGGIDVRGVLNAGGVTSINAAVQVKKWKRNVQARTVRTVRGSLTTQEQGIIITTSGFSKGAREEANAIGKTPISLVDGEELLDLLIHHDVGVIPEDHTVYSLDEEWWGELLAPAAELEQEREREPEEKAPVRVDYPLTVRAMNDTSVVAEMLNPEGAMRYAGKVYGSPSGAGKEASGWKSCNGWVYWFYQHPDTKEWRPIDELR